MGYIELLVRSLEDNILIMEDLINNFLEIKVIKNKEEIEYEDLIITKNDIKDIIIELKRIMNIRNN